MMPKIHRDVSQRYRPEDIQAMAPQTNTPWRVSEALEKRHFANAGRAGPQPAPSAWECPNRSPRPPERPPSDRRTLCSCRRPLFDLPADVMIEADVNLLDRRSRTRWHVDEEVAHICRQADRGHLEVARRTKCLDDVRGISRRADPENRASGCAVSFDLTREDRIVGIVVRQRGQDRRIRRQADAVQCATFFQETPDEFPVICMASDAEPPLPQENTVASRV